MAKVNTETRSLAFPEAGCVSVRHR